MLEINKRNFYNSILFASTLVILIFPAILNGYPLLHIDSAAYITSGQIGEIRIDSSFVYSLFLRHISLSWTLWLPILIQSFFISYIILILIRIFIRARNPFVVHFILVLFLFFFTGISYYTSLILPHIFTSTAILSLLILLFLSTKRKMSFILTSGIFGFSVITSFSNIPLIIVICLTLLSLTIFFWKHLHFYLRRICYVLSLLVLSLLLFSTFSYMSGAGFKIQRAKNILLSAQLLDLGISQKYLDSHCQVLGNKAFSILCESKDQLKNYSRSAFLYSQNSPLYRDCENKDWQECWLHKNETHGQLIEEVFSEKVLLTEYIARTISRTLKQLIIFSSDELPFVGIDSEISRFYEDDNYSYQHSVQKEETLSYSSTNVLQIVVVNACLVGIIILLFKLRGRMERELYLLLFIGLCSLFFNAFINAVFGELSSNVQGKLIFIIPMLFLFLLMKYLKLGKNDVGIRLSSIL